MTEDNEKESWFYRNRKKFWGFTALLVLLTGLIILDSVFKLGILAVLVNPVILGIFGLAFFIAFIVYIVRNFVGSGSLNFGAEEEGIRELSLRECEEIAKEYLFREDRPVIPIKAETKEAIPVTDEQTHEADVEVFTYVFTDKLSRDRFSIQFPVSQDIEFEMEWIDSRDLEDMRNIRDAVRNLENVSVNNLENIDKDESEFISEKRQELGEVIVREKRTITYDDRGLPLREEVGSAPAPDEDSSRLIGEKGAENLDAEDLQQIAENMDTENQEE